MIFKLKKNIEDASVVSSILKDRIVKYNSTIDALPDLHKNAILNNQSISDTEESSLKNISDNVVNTSSFSKLANKISLK